MTLAIPWHQMTGREQLVWAAAFAPLSNSPSEGIRLANQAIRQLREQDPDSEQYSRPEYEAARCGPGLTIEEFRAWYPIALKLARNWKVSADEITDQACLDAFNTYQQCSADFY